MNRLVSVFYAGVALCVALPLYAQDKLDIDEIVVTTTRDESLRYENNGNITIIDPQTEISIFATDLVNQAPGVLVHRGNGQEHLTSIRSPVLVGGAGAGSFLYLEDGVSLRAPAFANINGLMDAMPEFSDRVEVVRGPASALYGSNALHGMINFISGPIEESATKIDAQIGSYGRFKLVGDESHIGADDIGYRLGVGLSGEKDAFRDEAGHDQQKIKLQYGNADYLWSLSFMNLNQETAGYIGEDDEPGLIYEDEDAITQNDNPEAYRDAQNARMRVEINKDLDNGRQLSLTPYMRNNEMEFLMHFLPTDPVEDNAHSSIGMLSKYIMEIGDIYHIFGLDMDYSTGSLREVQEQEDDSRGNYLQGTHYDYEVVATTIAPFVHIEAQLSPQTELTAGMRYEMVHYDYDNKTDTGVQGKLYRPADDTQNYADLSPKIGLNHILANNDVVFARVARAVRAPQTTDLYRLRWPDADEGINPEPDPDDIDSETLDSVELGYRGGMQNLFFEITAYVMRKRNYHFRDANDLYIYDGKTKHYGMELDIEWNIMPHLSLGGSASYGHHSYDFSNDVDGANATETITSGDMIDSAPKTLGNMRLAWQASPQFTSALQWEHVGPYFMDASNTAEYAGHDLFNITLSYRMDAQLNIEAAIYNVLDERYALRADKWFGNNRYFPGEPRRLSIGVKARF